MKLYVKKKENLERTQHYQRCAFEKLDHKN